MVLKLMKNEIWWNELYEMSTCKHTHPFSKPVREREMSKYKNNKILIVVHLYLEQNPFYIYLFL